jgi:ribose/xylose/arabinose/galactoside ABC-type transport system permease subunit
LVNFTGLHPFIITLGTNAIFRGGRAGKFWKSVTLPIMAGEKSKRP